MLPVYLTFNVWPFTDNLTVHHFICFYKKRVKNVSFFRSNRPGVVYKMAALKSFTGNFIVFFTGKLLRRCPLSVSYSTCYTRKQNFIRSIISFYEMNREYKKQRGALRILSNVYDGAFVICWGHKSWQSHIRET